MHTVLTFDVVNFKAKKISGNKNEHFIIIKFQLARKSITILNMKVCKNKGSKYKKQKWVDLKERQIHKYSGR